jgi:hypothetical protein
MTTEHWILVAAGAVDVGLNAWALWIAYQVHRAQVIDILQGRT